MAAFFAEQLTPLGNWSPVKFASKPDAKQRSFQLRSVSEIHPCHEHLTLDQLAEVYGENGKFRSIAK